jgi:hypothetical protein
MVMWLQRLAASIVPRFDSVTFEVGSACPLPTPRLCAPDSTVTGPLTVSFGGSPLPTDHAEIVGSVGDEEEAAAINVENNPGPITRLLAASESATVTVSGLPATR